MKDIFEEFQDFSIKSEGGGRGSPPHIPNNFCFKVLCCNVAHFFQLKKLNCVNVKVLFKISPIIKRSRPLLTVRYVELFEHRIPVFLIFKRWLCEFSFDPFKQSHFIFTISSTSGIVEFT